MLNLEKLEHIADGDQALLEELLSTFLQSTREDLLNLKAAVNNQQNPLIVSLAHRIKGGAVVVGADYLATLAGDMENVGKQASPDHYEPLLFELQETFKSIEASFPDL